MKRLLLFLVLIGCTDIDPHSIVKVTDEKGYMGTGYFVTENYISTVAHYPGEGPFTVEYIDDNGEHHLIDAVVVDRNASIDRMTLEVEVEGNPVDFCEANWGSKVSAWGWLTTKPIKREGYIYWKNSNKYWTTANGQTGFSGGPLVYKKEGCVIGQITGMIAETNGIYARKE